MKFRDSMLQFRNFLKEFLVPAILIILWMIFLNRLHIASNTEQEIVLGIILGTSLGFITDIFRSSLDNLRQKTRIRSVAKKLLAQDALGIFRTMEMYKQFQEDPNKPEAIKKNTYLPLKLDLHYWQILSSDKDFILLAGESPFDDFYRIMWNFEKLNNFRKEAEIEINDPQLKDKPKPMTGIYMAAYAQSMKDNDHLNFALNFYTENMLKKELSRRK